MAAPLSILLKLDGMEAVQRDFDKIASSMQKLGDKMVSVGKTMSLAVTVPLTAFAVIGIKELSSVQAAMAQTGAAIKSTGGAAGISAEGVRKLAESLQQKSAVDAEVIQSGANLLLTFTNVRNVVGENNDIFNRATKTSLDLSRSMGMDLSSASIMLGKALNDPIKGITAMGRAGVQFTDVQKDQIKALVESGKTLEAQKIILKELETQVGGSAEAYSKTLGGSLALMKINVEDLAGSLVQALEPAITGIIAFAMKWLNWFNSLDESTKSIIATIGVLVAAIGPLVLIVGKAITIFKSLSYAMTFIMNMNPYILAIGLLIAAGVALYMNWDKVAAIARVVWNNVKLTVLSAVEIMLDALEHFTGWIPWWGTQISAAAVYIREMRLSVEKDMQQIHKPMAEVETQTLKTSKAFKDMGAEAPGAISKVTDKVVALGDGMKKSVIPEFHNLASVQREMSARRLPELKAEFISFDKNGLRPANKALGDVKLTTSLLTRTYFPELKKETKSATDIMSTLTAELDLNNRLSLALGSSYDSTAAKTDLVRKAIEGLIAAGTDPASDSIRKLNDDLLALQIEGSFKVQSFTQFAVTQLLDLKDAIVTNLSGAMSDAIMGKDVDWEKLWKEGLLKKTLDAVIAYLIEMAIVATGVKAAIAGIFGVEGGGTGSAAQSGATSGATNAVVGGAAGGGTAAAGGSGGAAGGGVSAGTIGGAVVVSAAGAAAHAELTRKDDTWYGSLMAGGTPWQDQKLDEWGGFLNVATAPFQGETATWGAMMNTGEGKKVLEILNNPGKAIKNIGQKLGLPGFARGGIISTPSIIMAGEGGAEAIVPLNNPRRAAAVMSEAGLSGGGTTIQNVYNGPVILDKLTMRKWTREQMRMLQQEAARYA